jgi:hypothetical protein
MSEILSAGRLEDHPFAELSGLIFQGNRTGELILESDHRRRTVWFLGGNPVAVASDDRQDHLAQFLLEHGKIGEEEAHRLADLPETREALATADFIPKDTLNWGVKSRFVNLCYDLFRWETGDYSFQDGEPPRDLFLLKVPTHSLVFKGVGLLGQASVADAVPDDAVCGAGPLAAAVAKHLAPDALHLLEECQPGRTVAELVGEGSVDADQARRLLYALVCLGAVALSRGGPAAPRAEAPEPEEEPGFILDDEDDAGVAAPPPQEPPAHRQAAAASRGEEHGGGDFTLDLPPLAAEDGTAAMPAGDFDKAGALGSPGSFPFDDESATGSFGSFSPEETPQHHGKVAAKAAPKGTGRRLHVPRVVGIVLGAVAAAGIIGFAGWWWMSGSGPAAPPVKPPVKRPVPAAPPAAPTASAPVASPAAAPVPTAPAPPAPAPAPPSPAPAAAPVAVAPVAAPAPAAVAPASRPSGASGSDRYRNALEVFRAGDLDGAAVIWEGLLAQEHRGAFTLQLLTACQHDTIRDAQRSLSPQELYLVTKKVNGRSCFRICVGTFDSRDAAARALAALPSVYRAGGASIRPVADVLAKDR